MIAIPPMLNSLAATIVTDLTDAEAEVFFVAFLRQTIGKEPKALARVAWQFLAAELRALPAVSPNVQAVIDHVIAGMDLLASGEKWHHSLAAVSRSSLAAASNYGAGRQPATAAAYAARAAHAASTAHSDVVARAVARAADECIASKYMLYDDVFGTSDYIVTVCIRQRDTLLSLIAAI